MDDFQRYIRRQIANLIKPSNPSFSPSSSCRTARNHSLKASDNLHIKSRIFWEEFSRQKLTKSRPRSSLPAETMQKTPINLAKRSNSTFFKRMIAEEFNENSRLTNQITNKNSCQVPQNTKVRSKSISVSRRETVYQKLNQPITFKKQVSGLSDGYLQSKKGFVKRPVSSFEAFSLFKIQ